MKKINHITFSVEFDEWPDVSYLGEISTQPTWKEGEAWIPVDPENFKDYTNPEWFSPCNHLPHKKENWIHVSTEDKQDIIKKYGSLRKADIAYAYEDLKRLQHAGHWWIESYIIRASIAMSDDGEHWAFDEIIVSLGGIKSDGDDQYKKQITNDIKDEMIHELEIWGFARWEILNAMCEMKTEDKR
jgi:hypothetical protein